MSVWQKLSRRFVDEVVHKKKDIIRIDEWRDPPNETHITCGWDFLPIIPMAATPNRDVCVYVESPENLQKVLATCTVFDNFQTEFVPTIPPPGKLLTCLFDVRLYRTLVVCVDNYTSNVAMVITYAVAFGVDLRVLQAPRRIPPWGLNSNVDHKELLRTAVERIAKNEEPGWFIEIGASNDGMGLALEKKGWRGVMYDYKKIKLTQCQNRHCVKIHKFISDSTLTIRDTTVFEGVSISDAVLHADKLPSFVIFNCKRVTFDTSRFRWVVVAKSGSSLGPGFPVSMDGYHGTIHI